MKKKQLFILVFLFKLFNCYAGGDSLSICSIDSANGKTKNNFSLLFLPLPFENGAYQIEEVVFQKKNSKKTYTIHLPTVEEIIFKNKRWGKTVVPKPSLWKHIAPIITHLNDSLVTVKFHKRMNREEAKEFNLVLQELKRSKAFTRQEKEYKYFMLAYPDSAIIPIDSIKKFRFSRFNSRKKHFYSDIRAGFNEQRNPELVKSIFSASTILVGVYILASVSAAHFPIAFAVVATKVIIWDMAGYLVSTKGINLKRWKPLAA